MDSFFDIYVWPTFLTVVYIIAIVIPLLIPIALKGVAYRPIGAAKLLSRNMLIYGPLRNVLGMSRVRVAYTAGEAIGPDLFKFYRSIGINLKQLYGSTETSVFVCVQPDGQVKSDTVGPAVKGVELKFTPQRELLIRSPGLFKEYYKNPQATREAFAGGWFHSGDLAVMQPDGYVKIKDRSKDIIISGGENISSLEVEDILYRHPAVLAAAVVARPDEKWGETPCAFVELKPGSKTTEQEIIEFCRGHLARFKAPRAVVFGELPKTSTGKIQKFLLREKAKSASAIDT